MRMTVERGMTPRDAESVARWINERGADFLCQWAGPYWRFPVTAEQVMCTEPYSIFADGRFAGTIAIVKKEKNNAHIGRFLLDPSLAGGGVGTAALEIFCGMLFEDASLDTVSLNVYDYNGSAKRCYEKCGFAVTNACGESGGPSSVHMVLRRENMA